MTDASGVVVWAADYKPFGEATVTLSTITNNLRFPGQYYDAETGLYYNYYRDYNPVVGRYIEADPIGINKGQNHLYVFVSSNPLVYADPFGLEKKCVKPTSSNASLDSSYEHKKDKSIHNYLYFELPCSSCEKATSVELKIKKTYDPLLSYFSKRETFLRRIWDPWTPCGATGNVLYEMESRAASTYGTYAVALVEVCYECVKCK